ncbi:MAG: ADP-ribosylglycohydrolase family protein [Planctomycetes bacterium]|nr:ADP-ribosylglycohydrolase family protein [Planctomycetota bacterium]
MSNHLIREKSAGTLVGMAVGDALGAPAEGKTRDEIRSEFGCLDRFRESFDLAQFAESSKDMEPRLRESQILRWRPAGVYTDDTQQALVICDCLLKDRELLGDQVAELMCRLAEPQGRDLRFGLFRGAGKSFRDSIRALQDGVDWRHCGQDSASNGAAMRVAPLGIYLRGDLDRLKQSTIDQSILTHRDAMAIAAAQSVAHAVALLISIRSLSDPRAFLGELLQHVRAGETLAAQQEPGIVTHIEEGEHGFSDALARVPDFLDLPMEDGIARIGEYAEAKSQRPGIGGTGGYVLASVVSALYIFLKNLGSYERAVLAAVNQGGDTDTIGALVGAMAGTLHGYYAIPVRWATGLKNLGQIRQRAEALAGDSGWTDNLRPLAAMEQLLGEQILDDQKPFLPRRQPESPPPPVPQGPPSEEPEPAEGQAEEPEERFPRSGGYDRGGQDRGGQDRGGYDRGGQDRGGQDRGGQDRGGYDRGGSRDRGGARDRGPRRDDRRPHSRRGGDRGDRGDRGRRRPR